MSGMRLSIAKREYRRDNLERAFFMFMTQVKPKVRIRTIGTYCSDAFFILDRLPRKWVDFLLFDIKHSDADKQASLRGLIRQEVTACRTNPDKDARSYTRTFWYLVEFLRMVCVIEDGRMARKIKE